MSYLVDKKIKRKKVLTSLFFLLIFLTLFYFRAGMWGGLSYVSHGVFRPVLALGSTVGEQLSNVKSFFISKNTLYLENQQVRLQLSENEVRMSNYNSILAENLSLKEILARRDTKMDVVVSAILAKPNQSLYDTLVIDVGEAEGIQKGKTVFALGNIPIGRVANIYAHSSKVILFSNSGEKTQVVAPLKLAHPSGGSIFFELVGRGGGNFEMIMPSNFTLVKGDEVVLPGITPSVVAVV